MPLTERHISVIQEYLATNEKAASYAKFFGGKNKNSDKVAASNFFKRAEVKRMVDAMQAAKEKALLEATEMVYSKMYGEKIATETELDIFHTQVMRGEVNVKEVFAVKEKKVVVIERGGKRVPVVEERVTFQRVERPANIRERQLSARELYLRNASYKQFKNNQLPNPDNQDDQAAAEQAKNGATGIERVFVLSNGERLPMPE